MSKGVSLGDASIAIAFFYLGVAVFEAPTGYFADRYGRKFSTLIGLLGISLGFGIVGLSTNPIITWVAFLTASLGYTLISGAKDEWFLNIAEDNNPKLSQKKELEKFNLNIDLLGRVANISGSFFGVYLISTNPDLMWFLNALIGFVTIVILFKTPAQVVLTWIILKCSN